MKKILVALAIAAFASASFAKVENSKHDFNTAGNPYSQNLSSRCAYCHVPHNAQTWANTALWATNQATQAIVPYADLMSRGVDVGNVDIKESQTCLACHGDGSMAVTGLAQAVDASKIVGVDLRNDHPIGENVVVGQIGTTLTSNGAASLFPSGAIGRAKWDAGNTLTVECATCHSVHGLSNNTINGRKLLYGGQGGVAGGTYTSRIVAMSFCEPRS